MKDALRDVIPRLRGAFSAVLLTHDEVIGFRDPYGVRPLVLGSLDGRYVLASETAALDIIGAKPVREIAPGEMCWLDEEGYHIEQVVKAERESLCIFEFIYFARPDSAMKGQTLYGARVRMGEELAAESPVEADMVIPVPDTGKPAAIGFAARSGVPLGEGLIKNRYVGRTFIDPDDNLRKLGIRMKFNPLASAIKGKRLVVVDDSIVRGNTTSQLVRMLLDSGAAEVHLRISSPPIVFPCFYGIDMADQDEFIAFNKSLENIAEELGATTLAYLSLSGLLRATRVRRRQLLHGLFQRVLPVRGTRGTATLQVPLRGGLLRRAIGEVRAGGCPSAGRVRRPGAKATPTGATVGDHLRGGGDQHGSRGEYLSMIRCAAPLRSRSAMGGTSMTRTDLPQSGVAGHSSGSRLPGPKTRGVTTSSRPPRMAPLSAAPRPGRAGRAAPTPPPARSAGRSRSRCRRRSRCPRWE